MLETKKPKTRRGYMMERSLSTLLLMAPLGMLASPLLPDRVATVSTINAVQQQSSKVNQRTLTGTVTDEQGEPIVGATVIEHGKKTGTITNGDGAFSLATTPGTTLTISYVGFAPQTVKARNGMRVILSEEAKGLDEVVVVGYGTMKKRDLTGAVSSVKGTDLAVAGVASAAHMLAGKAAGLYVRQNSAQPGGGLDILIRGAGSVNASNEPLYIVDGFPIAKLDQQKGENGRMDPGTQGVLNFLNPNDVESIEVLKDASATAIYGARAANGVVIVTTKRGREGKAVVNYSYNYSYQHYSDKYDVLSLRDWMIEKNKSSWEYWIWENEVGPWGSKTLEAALAAPKSGLAYTRPYTDAQIAAAGAGTDWVGLITRNGHIQEHNLSIQGGSKDTQYMISLNYYDNEGIVRNSGMSRYTVKSNIDQRFLNVFKAGVNLTLTRIDNNNTQLGSAQFEKSGIIRSAVQMGPNILAYDPVTGTYPVNPLLGTQPNPYSLLNNIDKGRTDRFLGNMYVEARPIEGLTLRVNAGLDRANISRKTYEPKSTLYGRNLQGNGDIYTNDNNQYLLEATATYAKTIKEQHKVNLLAGTSYEQFNVEGVNSGNNNFLLDGFLYNNLNAGTGTKRVGSSFSKNKMESYFFRVNYIFKDRYYLTGTFRADGASVFAKNHKWGYFPSAALGWTFSEEPFMKSLSSWLTMGKMRLSWGQTGNSNIGSNAFASYYAQPAYNQENGTQLIGVFQGKLENPNLKWETTTEWNFGMDFGFLNNRILASVEFYHRVISDLLNYKPLNYYHDISQVMANIGKTQSTGLELTINTTNVQTRDFKWTTNFTFTTYKDRWKERTPDWKPAVYEKVDDPIRPIYSRRADHILQIGEAAPAAQPDLRPGELVIKDLNGYKRDSNGQPEVDANGRFILTGGPDGKIDDADVELIGSQDPGWMAGMVNSLTYKDFDFSFQLNGMFDRRMEDPTEMAYGLGGGDVARYGYNALSIIKKRWTWDNPSTQYPCSFNGWGNSYTHGDWYYQKAWFVRLSNITLGWSMPKAWIAKAKYISRVHLSLSASNLFCITPYKGLDPETDYYTAAYPNARTYSLGVNITF
ncbi:MAG: TonB-dependent receptor [Prevotella sp.]|nr:TonB-dependent receptor [Prevotella sp.]